MSCIWNFSYSFGKRKQLDVLKGCLALANTVQKRKQGEETRAAFCIAMFLAGSCKLCQKHMRSVVFADRLFKLLAE